MHWKTCIAVALILAMFAAIPQGVSALIAERVENWAELRENVTDIRIDLRVGQLLGDEMAWREDVFILSGDRRYHAYPDLGGRDGVREYLELRLEDGGYVGYRDDGIRRRRDSSLHSRAMGHVFILGTTAWVEAISTTEGGEWVFRLHNAHNETDLYRVDDLTGIVLERKVTKGDRQVGYTERRFLSEIDREEAEHRFNSLIKRAQAAESLHEQNAKEAAYDRLILFLFAGLATIGGVALVSYRQMRRFGPKALPYWPALSIAMIGWMVGGYFLMEIPLQGFYTMVLAIPVGAVVAVIPVPVTTSLYIVLSLLVHVLVFGAIGHGIVALLGRWPGWHRTS
ncbi:hypothetical protein [Desulfonatronum sp. SC1]|uniref:hypothetical protein n=1 Tax=Desulfonatronum sp. SC1 TaxID=2109626 RepID=UPI000D311263|nr:hypothetical protein [Desulfonatronum sp. SC1]PTN36130.1 hypothetical protein C6366_10360 [Desulfonatronum sp. SC1]